MYQDQLAKMASKDSEPPIQAQQQIDSYEKPHVQSNYIDTL